MGRKRKKKKLWSKQSKYKRKDGSVVMMDSTWETVMAMRLDELNVEWKRDENMKLALRQEKFIKNLTNALIRIENKTYGICRSTGKLISKERLNLVPHATLSIEAKRAQ